MTEVKLTPAQIEARVKRDEKRWAMAQKISEVGEFAVTQANRILQATEPLELQTRELMFGCLSLAVSIAKRQRLPAEQLTSMMMVMYEGVEAALESELQEEQMEKKQPGEPEVKP